MTSEATTSTASATGADLPEVVGPICPLPEPLRYHRAVVECLRTREPELWAWSASAVSESNEAAELRTSLLKTYYRLDSGSHPDLASRCALIAHRLKVNAPVTMYQAQGDLGMNATLMHLPNEAHLIFAGPILEKLTCAELDAVLAHELAHQRLWEADGGVYLVADRVLMQAATDPRATASQIQTARHMRLYTEVYADRASLAGCGDLHTAVAALVKTSTGLSNVSAGSYLRQADEIFAQGETRSAGVDHPETFIRARALRLWAEQDSSLDDWLTSVIEGPMLIDELDIASQQRMAALTRRFLAELLRPRWFQTDAVLAHAKAFFPDFTASTTPDESLLNDIATTDHATREYWLCLLLDFAAVDPDLDETALAAAIAFARGMNMLEAFEKLAIKELAIPKRRFTKVKKEAPDILIRAEVKP